MKNNFSKTLVVLIGVSTLTSSCFKNFYLTNSQKALNVNEAERVNAEAGKFVIVHFSDKTFELKKYTITDQTIEGELSNIEIPEHLLYLNPEENSSNRYKKKYESAVLNEVHIYTLLKSNLQNTNHILIAAKDISRIDIYQKDKNRTKVNHILSDIGLAAGVSFLFVTILLLTSGPWIIGPIWTGSI
jgi:hypothetical protein